jgi:hypothetical protein
VLLKLLQLALLEVLGEAAALYLGAVLTELPFGKFELLLLVLGHAFALVIRSLLLPGCIEVRLLLGAEWHPTSAHTASSSEAKLEGWLILQMPSHHARSKCKVRRQVRKSLVGWHAFLPSSTPCATSFGS